MYRLRFLLAFSVPLSLYISLKTFGIYTYIPLIIFFGAVPFIELIINPDKTNLDVKIAEDEKNKSLYDWILYITVPIQVLSLIYFLVVLYHTPFLSIEYFGRVTAMGLLCGVFGINVGHELGHRHKKWEVLLGEILLLTSLNNHFLIYHNGGHHLHVATPEDPATASKNEWLFSFWFNSLIGGYFEAWQLENHKMKRRNLSIFSPHSKMVVYTICSFLLIFAISYFLGSSVVIGFMMAALMGMLLLETVNYIEHYGLVRDKNEAGTYQPVRHQHSWNSDHPLGRAILFNLSRHSDHHYNGSKKYQTLLSIDSSPQMPTGYPGMMLLALIPPLWFSVMNNRLDKIKKIYV